ncbi:Oxalate-binding protein [bioreactor metagenome]|uniref:Oxalate-binding protein n=1 Tax=bioreactor metagenome TaxID=1076179 RepID=A0A645B9C1_9ZZZZ
MIKRQNEMERKINTQMRGGTGDVEIIHLLSQGEYNGKARLIGVINLESGCSIGEHIHENEEEIFYVISGEATYDDNGKTEMLSVGDTCICKGGQKHSLKNNAAEKLSVFAVILTY